MQKNTNDIILDALFHFFGLMDNPAEKMSKNILKESPAEKMHKDISKVNKSLKDSYLQIKLKALSISE